MRNGPCRLAKMFAPVLLFAGAIAGAASTEGSAQAVSDEMPVHIAMHAFMVNAVNPAANTIWASGYADKLSEQDWRLVKRRRGRAHWCSSHDFARWASARRARADRGALLERMDEESFRHGVIGETRSG